MVGWRGFFLLIALGLGLLPVTAAAVPLPVVTGQVKPEFARILFSWPTRVPFHAAMSGRTLRVTFERQASPNLGVITSALGSYVESARMEDDRTAVITLRHPYPVRTFISNSSSGIDLLQIHSPRFAKNEPAEPATKHTTQAAPAASPKEADAAPPAAPKLTAKQKKAALKAEKAKAKAEKATPQKIKIMQEKKAAAAPLATVTSAEIATPQKAAPAQPATSAKPAMLDPNADMPRKTAREKPPVITAPLPQPAKPAPVAVAVAAPLVEKPAPAATSEVLGSGMPVSLEKKKNAVDFHFPWKDRVAASAFVRGQTLWIVFSKAEAMNLVALKTVLPAFVTSIEQFSRNDATVLAFHLNEPLLATIAKAPDSYEWAVGLARRAQPPADPVAAQTFAEPPSILLPALEMADPVAITAPENGEKLVVVPVYRPSEASYPPRRFVDVDVLRAAQGIAVHPINSELRVFKTRDGVRLSTPDGLALSSSLPPVDPKIYAVKEGDTQTFFPYEHWKVKDDSAFRERASSLRRQISEAPDPEVSELRRKLAELYLGRGLAEETVGILNLIHDTDPAYYTDNQLAAMHGAANFLMGRTGEAMADFNEPSLEGEPEMDYWQRLTAVMNGDEKKPIHYTAFHEQFEKFYPPEMRRRIALLAADQAITDKDYPAAMHIMQQLKDDNILDPIKEYRDFMEGRIYAESGDTKRAEKLLQDLVDNSNDRFIRARAGFTLATTRFKAGEIDKTELMRELDQLRIVWRGDQLELSILELLGDLYVENGRYVEGLRAWKELLAHYPNTPDAATISAKMEQTFVKLFNGGGADKMTPLQALGIYYEFHDLTPLGKDGDLMVQNLADRLAAVDLLDRAAALLEHQVAFRLEKEDRSRVGARLALIYLLNKQPKEAIHALELTGYGNDDDALKLDRQHLAAQAYAQEGDTKTALGILKDDYTIEGKQIRLDIYWDAKDWPNVVATGEDLLANRKNITAPLNDTESQTLLRLAIAYTFQDDALQLQYLRDYFTPLMAASPNKDAFEFITSESTPISPENLQKVSQEMSRTKLFIDQYKDSVAKGDLSKTMGK